MGGGDDLIKEVDLTYLNHLPISCLYLPALVDMPAGKIREEGGGEGVGAVDHEISSRQQQQQLPQQRQQQEAALPIVSGEALKLRCPFSMILAGPSRAGKTTFVYKLLAHASKLMSKQPEKVVMYYNQEQPLLHRMKKEGLVHMLVAKLPSVDDVKKHVKQHQNGLIIIDDFMKDANDHVAYMFTALSHHHNVSVVFITQNLFSQHGPYRDMSLSATYLVCFKNPRDASQMWNFARQFSPDKPSYVVQGYRAITKQRPYSYVLFDFHPCTSEYLRMRTLIFPDEWPSVVVMPRNA